MLWLQIPTAAQAASQASTRDDLIKGLAAGALGLIGTVVTILVGWLKDRDTSVTRVRQLDEACKRVAFWESWYKAIAPLDSGNEVAYWRERARTQMWFAAESIEALFKADSPKILAQAKSADLRVQQLPRWRRWLLFYKPPRARAWIPRLIFYSYFFLGPIQLPLQFHSERVLNKERVEFLAQNIQALEAKEKALEVEKNPTPEMLKEREQLELQLTDIARTKRRFEERERTGSHIWIVALMGAIFSMAIGLLFRSWSVHLEKPKETSKAVTENKVPNAQI